MANLRDLVGEYVVRTKPVSLGMHTRGMTLFDTPYEKFDRSYMSVNSKNPLMCREIINDVVIMSGYNCVPWVLSSDFDDDNWKSVTKAIERCRELWKEETNNDTK